MASSGVGEEGTTMYVGGMEVGGERGGEGEGGRLRAIFAPLCIH